MEVMKEGWRGEGWGLEAQENMKVEDVYEEYGTQQGTNLFCVEVRNPTVDKLFKNKIDGSM